MASGLSKIDATVNSKLLNENNIFINSTKMDAFATAISNNEKAIAKVCKDLAAKTKDVVKKDYCAGVHKAKLTKFSNNATKIAQASSKAGTNLKRQVEDGVKAYKINLLKSASSWEEALPLLVSILS